MEPTGILNGSCAFAPWITSTVPVWSKILGSTTCILQSHLPFCIEPKGRMFTRRSTHSIKYSMRVQGCVAITHAFWQTWRNLAMYLIRVAKSCWTDNLISFMLSFDIFFIVVYIVVVDITASSLSLSTAAAAAATRFFNVGILLWNDTSVSLPAKGVVRANTSTQSWHYKRRWSTTLSHTLSCSIKVFKVSAHSQLVAGQCNKQLQMTRPQLTKSRYFQCLMLKKYHYSPCPATHLFIWSPYSCLRSNHTRSGLGCDGLSQFTRFSRRLLPELLETLDFSAKVLSWETGTVKSASPWKAINVWTMLYNDGN